MRSMHNGYDDHASRETASSRLKSPDYLCRDCGSREVMGLSERPRDHQGDVVLLFSAGELLDCPNNCLEKWPYREMAMRPKSVE